jgi:hypothetical protein
MEVFGLLGEAEQQAMEVLSLHIEALNRVVDLLLERETIGGAELAAVVAGQEVPPAVQPPARHRKLRQSPVGLDTQVAVSKGPQR